MSSADRNRGIVREFFEAISRVDVAKLDELYADDFEIWTAGTLPLSGTSKKAEALEGMKRIGSMFPEGLEFAVLETTVEGERVAIEAESRGVHVSGKPYHQLYHFLMVVRNGKIHRLKEYMDTMHAAQVLFGAGEGG